MKNYEKRPLEKWTVRDFHDYLTDKTAKKFGVTYAPFGVGPVSNRWRLEQGQVKNAQKMWGNRKVKAFIDYCVDNYVPNADYPFISFGFMFAYRRDDLARVEKAIAAAEAAEAARTQERESGVGSEWY